LIHGSTTGYEYLYFDNSTRGLNKSIYKVSDSSGAVMSTLAAIFKSPSNTQGWIIYNDEKPPGFGSDHSTFGHTKGLLAFDTNSNQAIWLLHSWPKWMTSENYNNMKGLSVTYGQTMLCISISLDALSQIADTMLTNQQPQVFESRIPGSVEKNSPLYKLSQPFSTKSPASNSSRDFTTLAGYDLKVICKNRQWNQDFWDDLVEEELGDEMDVESWIRGSIIPDDKNVHDIKYIDWSHIGIPLQWSETQDHAKWGFTVNRPWVCVGDINRMLSQRKRGGGAICFQNRYLWKNLKDSSLMAKP